MSGLPNPNSLVFHPKIRNTIRNNSPVMFAGDNLLGSKIQKLIIGVNMLFSKSLCPIYGLYEFIFNFDVREGILEFVLMNGLGQILIEGLDHK